MKTGYAYIIAGLIILFSSIWAALGIKFAVFVLGVLVGIFLISAGVNWINEIKKRG